MLFSLFKNGSLLKTKKKKRGKKPYDTVFESVFYLLFISFIRHDDHIRSSTRSQLYLTKNLPTISKCYDALMVMDLNQAADLTSAFPL